MTRRNISLFRSVSTKSRPRAALLAGILWSMMLFGLGLIILASRGDAVWGWQASRSLLTAFAGFALLYIGASIRFGV